MAITITYGSSLSSIGGLADALDYYNNTFSQSYHYETGGFSTVDSNSVTVDGRTYSSTYSDLQYASESSSTGQSSAFIAEAATNEQLTYTYNVYPYHTLFGDIDSITLGEGLSSTSGLWSLTDEFISLSGLNSLNGGLSGGSVIAGSTGNNDTHNIIYDLMTGSVGTTGDYTDVLEGFLNSEGTHVIGTSSNDEFDAYSAQDAFVLNGGNDVVNAGFQTGTSGDVIDITGINGFANAAAAVAAVDYSTGNAVLTYYEGFTAHTVEITGVSSGLTTDNFVV